MARKTDPAKGRPHQTPPHRADPPSPPAPQSTHSGEPIGRPRVLTPEKQLQFCDLLRLGLTRTEAARFLGVTVRTLFNYERDNPDFAEAIKQALLETDRRAYSSVVRAGDQSWRAAAWLISHRSRQARPAHKPSAEALLNSPRFHELLREAICEAVVANEISLDSGIVHRKKRLRTLRQEIEDRQRRGEDASFLLNVAHDLTREIAKSLRLTMRSR
jgi:hypothetical protein